ncbi:hypothetical protein GR131_27530 [Streptomyces sp. GF20]|uniref:MAB_1171c family putative transporter n=1 Tax=Streptomyces sp. GF20 TaxID=2692235 RepID=UPI001316F5E4|nr:MAB_1171c family putative transporter [Streptomyces sp. GF20]QHC18885.1 hypothetical protein GR131_27530 [Streptomyces sp. GF20]
MLPADADRGDVGESAAGSDDELERGVRPIPLLGKAGLGFLGLGTLLGSLYAIQRVTFVVIHLSTDTSYPDLENFLSTLLKQAAVLSIAFGLCLPPLSVAVDYARSWDTLRRLRPLWRELTGAAPYVVLTTAVRRWRIPFRLERCVIEIEDASLALREYVSMNVYEKAQDFVRREGAPDEDVDAAAEAAWLRAAVQRTSAHQPLKEVEYPPLGVTDRDRVSELAWLLKVAKAYRSATVVEFCDSGQSFARQ